LKRLWLLAGDCLAADADIYQRIKDKISIGIGEINGVEFAKTKEIARINKVDPLGITYLRIRGMWGIENPVDIYDYLDIKYNPKADLQVISIMTEEKYNSFPESDIKSIEQISANTPNLEIGDVQIQSPNNPVNLIQAKLITYRN
jgi:NgoPII restriction endonuclease